MLELAISNWVVRLLVLLFIFAAATGSIILALGWVQARARSGRQFARLNQGGQSDETTAVFKKEREGRWAQIANRIEASGINLTDSKNQKLLKQLRAAGYRKPSAPRVYTLVRIILVFVLPAWYLLLATSGEEPPSITKLYMVSAGLGLLGLYLPNIFIRAKADRRRTDIINGFPDSLDLLLVCVEAGLGLEAALDRVGREMSKTHPLIAEIFVETTLLMRAGASRESALRKLSETGVDEIRSFATLLIQSDKLGTSIANTLRVYAGEMREARRSRAEEKAHRLPVLISIPLVVCMLPTMIGVLALPAAVKVVRDVLPAMGGG